MPRTLAHTEPSWPLKATLLAVAALTIMSGTVVSPSLPAIRQAFAGQSNVELMSRMVLTLPALFVVVSAPIAGAMADRYGRKRLLLAAILLYAAAGLSGLVATSLTGVLLGRAIFGLAVGAIMTVGTALVGDYFAPGARARFFGLQQAFTQIGGVVFVVGGGFLADVSWRAPFILYGLAFLIFPAAVVFVREPVRNQPDPTTPQSSGGKQNWLILALLCLTTFVANALFYTVPTQLAFHLKELGYPNARTVGILIGVFNLIAAISALSYGKLRNRWTIPEIFAAAFTLMAGGAMALSFVASFTGLTISLSVMGFGLGMMMPNIMASALQIAQFELRARVTGLVTACLFFGYFMSPILSQPVIAQVGYDGLYRTAGSVYAGLALVAVGIILGSPRAVKA
ncbi:MFS transporter [Paracoccus aminophilus]|uniref:MFS permease n=1 Tax=Paracoccus aminophilus JCM 7686 TaxID=1367847 RepID=S5XYV8_PARAH|nr:MFS transporter [Paracoccus aminophilus]AGT08620.1 MFS permease [Paracoccus aminophilus JCM 7686]